VLLVVTVKCWDAWFEIVYILTNKMTKYIKMSHKSSWSCDSSYCIHLSIQHLPTNVSLKDWTLRLVL